MKKTIQLLILFSLGLFLFFYLNHFRMLALKRYTVKSSQIEYIETIDEGKFEVELYKCDRTFYNRWLTLSQKVFTDKIMVIKIPIRQFKVKNIIKTAEENNEFSDDYTFYFNTLFFSNDFNPTKGLILNGEKVSGNPHKTRIGITQDNKLACFSINCNEQYKDIWQVPYVFYYDSKVKRNIRTMNFRHFIAFKDNELYYISGYKNSIISWKDVQPIMLEKGLKKVFMLDGGASLDYEFVGDNNTYSFSSIPMRDLWFELNSPFYLEGKLIK